MRVKWIIVSSFFVLSAFAFQRVQARPGEQSALKTASAPQPAPGQAGALAASEPQPNAVKSADQALPQPTPSQARGCLAVKDAGSHAVRNILLAGVAGALVSKKQYKVVDAVGYPARIGQKFHGNDLETLQAGGTRIVILDKKYSQEDLQRACR